MTDWIEHTTDTCPVDPETVVEVRVSPMSVAYSVRAGSICWDKRHWSHYRIITPAKPPEPVHEMKFYDPPPAKPETDLVALRLECLKLALQETSKIPVAKKIADDLLHYVLNGSVDKA
jgi:hypothetical protein